MKFFSSSEVLLKSNLFRETRTYYTHITYTFLQRGFRYRRIFVRRIDTSNESNLQNPPSAHPPTSFGLKREKFENINIVVGEFLEAVPRYIMERRGKSLLPCSFPQKRHRCHQPPPGGEVFPGRRQRESEREWAGPKGKVKVFSGNQLMSLLSN